MDKDGDTIETVLRTSAVSFSKSDDDGDDDSLVKASFYDQVTANEYNIDKVLGEKSSDTSSNLSNQMSIDTPSQP